MTKSRDKGPIEKVGKYEFTVCFGEPTSESAERWEQRSDAVFAWLMEQWKREQTAGARQADDEPGRPHGP